MHESIVGIFWINYSLNASTWISYYAFWNKLFCECFMDESFVTIFWMNYLSNALICAWTFVSIFLLLNKLHCKCMTQLRIPYRTKLRRTNFSSDKIFRRTKFSSPLEIFVTFVRRKILSIGNFVLFLKSRQWAFTVTFNKKKCLDKIFVGQNFSSLLSDEV